MLGIHDDELDWAIILYKLKCYVFLHSIGNHNNTMVFKLPKMSHQHAGVVVFIFVKIDGEWILVAYFKLQSI